MSYDVGLAIDTGAAGLAMLDVLDVNYTYNMSYAIYHGGISMSGHNADGRFVLHGALCSAAADALADCINVIRRDAASLREREPSNGWGSVDGVVSFLETILAACREHPNATVWVS